MRVYRYVCILVVILIMTIFTMSEGSRIIKIGYKITRAENELVRLSEEIKKLKFKSGKLKRPEKIALKVEDMNLGLSIHKDEDIAVVKKSHKSLNQKLHGKVEA